MEFTCAVCKKKFIQNQTDVESYEHFMQHSPKAFLRGDPVAKVCMNCFVKVRDAMKENGIEL